MCRSQDERHSRGHCLLLISNAGCGMQTDCCVLGCPPTSHLFRRPRLWRFAASNWAGDWTGRFFPCTDNVARHGCGVVAKTDTWPGLDRGSPTVVVDLHHCHSRIGSERCREAKAGVALCRREVANLQADHQPLRLIEALSKRRNVWHSVVSS